jgi:hypothetical protein
VLEIDQVRRMIYVHQLDVGSDRSVTQFYHQAHQVERLLVAAFEQDVEWQPAAQTGRGGRVTACPAERRVCTARRVGQRKHGRSLDSRMVASGSQRASCWSWPRHHDDGFGRGQHAGPAGRSRHPDRVTMCGVGTWAAFSLDAAVTYSLVALALISFVGSVSIASGSVTSNLAGAAMGWASTSSALY